MVDMKHPDQKIELYFESVVQQFHCNFNLKGEFILYGIDDIENDQNIIWVYSTRGNEWMCQKLYMTPEKAELLGISKYDRIWLRSNDHMYEWNMPTNNTTIISRDIHGVI